VEVFFAPPPPPLLFQELAESMLHPFRIIANPLFLGYFIRVDVLMKAVKLIQIRFFLFKKIFPF
jgi:hypothetical protein